MKTSDKSALVSILGTAFLMIGVFGTPLGIPALWKGLSILISMIVMYFSFRLMQASTKISPATNLSGPNRNGMLILAIVAIAIACIAMPFVLPLAGISLPFNFLIIISVMSFVIGLGITVLVFKLRK